ncbi:auxin canalization protein [Thalictrum thalictroides]|uniref:Auxin canalization protein n=1 Tax=Thalictrum thalictroides TaxID=46969 RepID=A0A7J6VZE0_THATH|nr:auxin canalization protein [Thalictrum thalictroides]
MESDFKLTALPQSPFEPMDFLSRDWCNSTFQVYHPMPQEQALVLQEYPIKTSVNDLKAPLSKMEKNANMDVPPWKGNDIKQAMHPEINYNRKKWLTWKIAPFKNISIKKWLKEIKQKRKEDDRLQRADVHAALSVAGLAAALAAVAAENNKNNQSNSKKEPVVATAAALIASQCAKMAAAMGAKPEQLHTTMGSAMTSASASELLSLTAAAATSLRGAATLRARPGLKDRFNSTTPVIPIEDSPKIDFDFDKFRSTLAKGDDLNIVKSDGTNVYRSVSIVLNREAKVILKIRKINILTAFTSTKEYILIDLHAELYKDSLATGGTSYYVVLTTNRGTIKLDMEDDYDRYIDGLGLYFKFTTVLRNDFVQIIRRLGKG